jgi:RecA-family ATPase
MADSRPGFVGVDEYLALPRDKETWILKSLIPVSGAALLYGAEKTGKSYLAIQLAMAISGQQPNFLGFPVVRWGRVLYLQLDTPRSVWAYRFEEMIKKGGLKYNNDMMKLADRECLDMYPFDILQPTHMKSLYALIRQHDPVAVIIDTLREAHSGDEDNSTVSRNVVANLVGATHPAALILISHSRKPNPEGDKNLMADHRGSSYITGRMDAIMRLTKTRLFYAGRSIEEGDIKLERLDTGLWQPKIDENAEKALIKVINDPGLPSLNAKGKALATLVGISETAAISRVRRSDLFKEHSTTDSGLNIDTPTCGGVS